MKKRKNIALATVALGIGLLASCSTYKNLHGPNVPPGITITFTGEQVSDSVYVTISPIPVDTTLSVKEYVEAKDNGRTIAFPVKDNKIHIFTDTIPCVYKILCDYYILPSYYLRSNDHLELTISSLGPPEYKVSGGIYSNDIPYADEFYKLKRQLFRLSLHNQSDNDVDSLTVKMNSLLDRMMSESDAETATRIITLLDQDFAPYAFKRLPHGSEKTLFYTYACALRNSASLVENRQKMLEQSLEPGAPVPDIVVNCVDGQVFDVSSLRGKWVVIDFWAAWCGPCKRGFEKMKKIYSRYSDKLEVVAIDCGDHAETWHAAVEELELPWINLLAPAPDANDGTVAGFPVPALPTKITIDPEGRLCDYTIGEIEDFYEKLEKLIK